MTDKLCPLAAVEVIAEANSSAKPPGARPTSQDENAGRPNWSGRWFSLLPTGQTKWMIWRNITFHVMELVCRQRIPDRCPEVEPAPVPSLPAK